MADAKSTNPWLKVAEVAAPLAIGAFTGHKAKQSASKASQGARLQDLLPQIQAMMAQQQQHSAQNYSAQQDKYAMTQPLMQGIAQNATNLLPHAAKMGGGGMSLAPSQSAAPSALAMPPKASIADLEAGYDRRGGGTGGAAKGALGGGLAGAGLASIIPGIGPLVGGGIGAIAGGIKGAFTKHASTAPTDFSVEDARQILMHAYQQYFGQPADAMTIEQAIRGQGWQPGDRFVGEGGLAHVLQAWQQQAGH